MSSFGPSRSINRRAGQRGSYSSRAFLGLDTINRCPFGTLWRPALLHTLCAATRPESRAHASRSASTAASASASTPGPSPPDLLLSDIRVVLVAPKHEANVGAVARACANFECLSLFLVAPRYTAAAAADGGDFGGDEARRVACGDAVLDRLVVTSSLSEALADTVGSIGFTRRAGATRLTHASLGHLLAEFPWALPLQPPPPSPPLPELPSPLQPQAAEEPVVPAAAQASVQCEPSAPELERRPAGRLGSGRPAGDLVGAACEEVGVGSGLVEGGGGGGGGGRRPYATALVFGREESGLTEAELRLCSHACAIPTGRLQPSMNLSHAAAVVLAELFSRRCGLLDIDSTTELQRAAAAVDADGGGARLLRLLPAAAAPAPAASDDFGTSGGGGGGASATACSDCGGGGGGNLVAFAARSLSATAAAPSVSHNPCSGSSGSGGVVAAVAGLAVPGAAAAAALAAAGVGGQALGDAGLLPASSQEVDLLVRKVAAVAEAVGLSGEEGAGGGGNHGRRRLPIGHLRSVVSRARVNAAESRSLHGLASAVLQRLDPDHPLEARKQQRRRQEHQKEQTARQADEHQQRMQEAEQ